MKSLFFLLLLSTPVLAQSPHIPALGPSRGCVTYYPPLAVRLHYEGVTTLAFQVTPAGGVTDITVKKSSGHPVLDDASVNCVGQWHYPPATADTSREVNVTWRLEDEDGQAPVLYMVERAALDCIKNAQPSDEALAKATKNTVVRIQLRGNVPPSVEMVSSSGNEDLDSLVVGCLNHLPSIGINFRMGFVIPFSWKADAQPKTGLAPAAAPK